jgi:hypothetical protein
MRPARRGTPGARDDRSRWRERRFVFSLPPEGAAPWLAAEIQNEGL